VRTHIHNPTVLGSSLDAEGRVRTLRLEDGPGEARKTAIARHELRKLTSSASPEPEVASDELVRPDRPRPR
jgi:hypothetical protein